MALYEVLEDGTIVHKAGKNVGNLDCLRTEVVYDMSSSDSNKNWGYTGGINGGITVSGKDFSKYKYLIITCADNRASGSVNNTWINTATLDLTVTRSAVSGFFTSLITASVSTSNFYKVVASVQVNNAKTSISLTSTGLDNSGNGFSTGSTDLSIIKIEGVLKTPAMIYTGKELFEGNGISIENGMISSKGFEFVGNYSATTAISIDIDLDKYDYFLFSSMETTSTANIGLFFSQGLSWTTKRTGNDGTVDNTLSGGSYAYLAWGRAMSAVNYIKYDGSKTLIQSGFSVLTGFSYATGKPASLTLSTDAGNVIVQSYITLFRRKK